MSDSLKIVSAQVDSIVISSSPKSGIIYSQNQKDAYNAWWKDVQENGASNYYEKYLINSVTVYQFADVQNGWKVLKTAWTLIGTARNESVQNAGILNGYRADCSGTLSYILNTAIDANIDHQWGGPDTSTFKKYSTAAHPVPGQPMSFNGHVGLWDPIKAKVINGINDCDVLSMKGKNNVGSFDYGHNSWWTGDKYINFLMDN